MTTVEAPPAAARLLKGLDEVGRRHDLAAHQAVHGPLPLPDRRDRSFADRLIRAVADAGLSGRGGAGFPTAAKLEWIRRQRRRPVLAVNACEGEPASRKDHTLAAGAPHLVLDGAELVARAMGAAGVSVCIRRADQRAAGSLTAAVAEREASGLVSTEVAVRQPPEGYITGEESALTHWLDGGDARPTFRPNRPAVLRSHGRPTLVSNAETLAHVALIARHGPAWFRSVGTAEAPGTTLVTVSGAVRAPGVREITLGLGLDEVLAAAGAEAWGAVLLGGYGGTWLGPEARGTALSPTALAARGASLGAGVVVALGAGSCGLAETARLAAYMGEESAGQCGPCVFGLPAIAGDLRELAFGRPTGTTVERLWTRCAAVERRGACHHPDGVARMVRSALGAFADDLHRHLSAGPCPAAAAAPTVLAFPGPTGERPWR